MSPLLWTAHNPVHIVAGPGLLSRLGEFVPRAGGVLLVTTPGFVRRGVSQRIVEILGEKRVEIYDGVTPNPELDDLDAASASLGSGKYGVIVALGGGSVMDAAKALSVAIPSGINKPLNKVFRESSGHLWASHIPLIAIPTTSGTGSEVTPFATVWDALHHKKYSVAGPRIFPQTALLDPELTLSLPPQETLYTALDAISHALESLWNKNRTPISTAYSIQALTLVKEALPQVLNMPEDLESRAQMQQASTLAGLAISQTRTAIAHSISYPLTTHYGVPHGLACSFTLVNVLDHYLSQNPDFAHTELLRDMRYLLQGLNLFAHLEKYATAEQINAIKGEMFLPGRADNFDGDLPPLDVLLSSNQD